MVSVDQKIDLWLTYTENKSEANKKALIDNYLWLIKYSVGQMNLPKSNILEDGDYLSIGMLGLIEAIERFEPERGVKFESYAIPRIRGIIQDELRKLDWLSRTARKKAGDLKQAEESVKTEKGREATQEEIMKRLNVNPEQFRGYLEAAAAAKSSMSMTETQKIQFDDEEGEKDTVEEVADPDAGDIITDLENAERVEFLTGYIKSMKEKHRLVISLYYYEELTFKEIGNVLNISESRVCQIHTQIIKDLRIKFNRLENA